jgi:hypothetical protein
LTDKVCEESGICNVKTQLMSRFFADASSGDLRVDGVAILAFGSATLMPSSATIARRLRAPIHGVLYGEDVKAFMATKQNRDKSRVSVVSVVADSSQRMLQDGAANSGFDLKVALQDINVGDSSGSAP